jgi:hypothetical protein
MEEIWAAYQLLDRREKGHIGAIVETMKKCDRKLFDSLVKTFPDQVPWAIEAGRKEHELCALTIAAALIALRSRPELLVGLAVVAEFMMQGKELRILLGDEDKPKGKRRDPSTSSG